MPHSSGWRRSLSSFGGGVHAQLDEVTFTISDQFALGDDLIVAPVVEKGARARDVYLTRGTWRDAFEPVLHCLMKLVIHQL